jgi:hydroxysqualene dehydroxylase
MGVRVTDQLRVAVIGGGWAGCSAAAELSASGHEVVLLEAAGELGGRARRLVLDLDGERHVLDNGQHLMIGAYRATGTLLASAGIDLDSVVLRRPFSVGYPDGMRLMAARLPAPWHLVAATVTARGLTWGDTIALAQFLPRARALDWTVAPDRPADGWLRQLGQTPRLIERLWRPLTLAALNTPLHQASAQILASVLRDSLGAHAGASEMWLPRSDLSAILPDAVERLVRARGGDVRRHHRVDLARCSERGWSLAIRSGGDHAAIDVDAVVYAAPAAYVQRIFGPHTDALRSELRMIERFRYEPITTVYLKYAATERRLPPLMHALLEDPQRRHYGQWVFNRGDLDADNAGVLALVISTGGTHEEPTLDGLCEAAARQLSDLYDLPAPRAARAVVERRATLACLPDLERPTTATRLSRLALAGDWVASEYPCTLETAVRSGIAAARWISGDNSADFG